MSFSNIQSAVKTVLQQIPALTNSVTLADDGIIDKGVTCAAIIRASNATFEEQVGLTVSATWGCLIELYQRYSDDATASSSFVTLRDSVIDKLLKKFPNINNPYVAATSDQYRLISIVSQGDPQDIQMKNGNTITGPVFRAQIFLATIQEYIVITP